MTAPQIPMVPQLPSKPTSKGAVGPGSQSYRRFTDTFWDLHKHPLKFPTGRPFTGEREFTSGTDRESITAGFITSDLQQGAYYCDNPEMGQTIEERQMTLASGWSAPWVPMAKYFKNAFNYRRKTIDLSKGYLQMESDERQGLEIYWRAAAKMAGDNDQVGPDKPVPFRIATNLGLPSKMIRVAQAARAGDPWLLGFVEEPNVELAKILGYNIAFIGGRSGDSEYTAVKVAEPEKPIVTPEQVLATPTVDLPKMIAEAVAAAMQARDDLAADKKRKDNERMAKMRDAKKRKPAEATT